MAERKLFTVKLKRAVVRRATLDVWATSPEDARAKAKTVVNDVDGLIRPINWAIDEEASGAAGVAVEGASPKESEGQGER